MRRDLILAGIGGVALLPALILVTAGLAGWMVPAPADSPVLVMGGLAAAIGLSFGAATRWEIHREAGAGRLSGTVRARLANLLVLVAGLGLLGIIAAYLFGENFQPRVPG